MGSNSSKNALTSLSDNELLLITSSTGLSQAEVKSFHQKFLSDFPDGLIDKKEFKQLFKKMFPDGNPSKFSEFAFEVFDVDKSGKINFHEFIFSTAFLQKPGTSHEKQIKRLGLAFDIFDSDNNHRVDKKEFEAMYKAILSMRGEKASKIKERTDQIFLRYDRDSSGYLSRHEFLVALDQENIFYLFNS